VLTLKSDLHVHTVLSPCAGIEMIPPLIVEEALQRGIRLIAITDHNATANICAVQKAARAAAVEDTELYVLPGMELQTREEVHVLCLFDQPEQAEALQAWVDAHLPNMVNNVEFFGEQFVVDETGDFIRREERLLSTSADVTLHEAWEQVNALGGLFIPAHVNRTANGLLAQLGLVPDDFPVEALEISRHLTPQEAVKKFPQIKGYPLIQDGDVHYLDGFLGTTEWQVEKVSVAELRKAIRGEDGRGYKISPVT
jgi:3',5'-nucleoside bisphosphate phosphatase